MATGKLMVLNMSIVPRTANPSDVFLQNSSSLSSATNGSSSVVSDSECFSEGGIVSGFLTGFLKVSGLGDCQGECGAWACSDMHVPSLTLNSGIMSLVSKFI
jgi:hypothetical protein